MIIQYSQQRGMIEEGKNETERVIKALLFFLFTPVVSLVATYQETFK